jgi:hypothetical protein
MRDLGIEEAGQDNQTGRKEGIGWLAGSLARGQSSKEKATAGNWHLLYLPFSQLALWHAWKGRALGK